MSLFLKITGIVALCWFFAAGMTYQYEQEIKRLEQRLKQREDELEDELSACRLYIDMLERER